MKPRQQVSRAAIELIKTFEGYRPKAAQLPDGRWTIGYGHTLTAREGAEVSEQDAEALLLYDLINVAHAVNEHAYTPLTQNQFDALCCFAFNAGVDNFRRSSVLRRVNEGQLLQAACAMEMWRKADFEGERIVIDALVRRRSAEKTLFLTPTSGWVPAPSPILRPKVDYDVVAASPRETPTVLKTATVDDKVVVERDEAASTARPATPPPVDPTPLATEVAAAGLGARLEDILPESAGEAEPAPGPVEPAVAPFEDVSIADLPPTPPAVVVEPAYDAAPEAETAPAMQVVELPPEPQPEPEAAAPARGPVLAVVNGDPAFTLTPAPEARPDAGQEDVFRIDMREPAAESAPGLFDVSAVEPVHQGGPTRPLVSEDYVRRLVREDDQLIMGEGIEPFEPTDQARISGLPMLALGLGGMALFAGGIAWGLTARAGDGALDPRVISLGLGMLGIVMAAFAAWRWLDGMARAPLDDEEDEDEELSQA